MYTKAASRRAFSLVELSIVLVILGLLVGGILAGKSLIRAGELRSVISDANRFNTAALSFRDKYFGWPGDITNATAIWGKDTATAGACAGQSGTAATPGTCNGNGDTAITNYIEASRFWQQLNLAGLVEGNYNGYISPAANTTPTVPGRDMPAARIGGGWTEVNLSQNSSVNFELGYSDLSNTRFNFMILGNINPAYWSNAVVLRPEEAWNVDSKIDDGLPGYGKLRGGYGNSTNCPTATTAATAQYNLANTAIACIIGMVVGG